MILYTTLGATCSLAPFPAAAQDRGLPTRDGLLRAVPRPLDGWRAGLITNRTGADLTFITAAGRRRNLWFDQIRLPWVPPAPNGAAVDETTTPWAAQLDAFRSLRRPYLLHPEENR